MVYVFLAEGFEEIEALAVVDVLRRGAVQVRTVGIGGRQVAGAHGIPVVCDLAECEAATDGLEMVVLPGGIPGTPNLEASETVRRFLDYAVQNDLWIGAICAAPSILGHRGLLRGREATANPDFQSQLEGARLSTDYVCADGRYITSRGMGVAVEFGLRLLEALKGREAAEAVHVKLQCRA